MAARVWRSAHHGTILANDDYFRCVKYYLNGSILKAGQKRNTHDRVLLRAYKLFKEIIYSVFGLDHKLIFARPLDHRKCFMKGYYTKRCNTVKQS